MRDASERKLLAPWELEALKACLNHEMGPALLGALADPETSDVFLNGGDERLYCKKITGETRVIGSMRFAASSPDLFRPQIPL